MEGEGRSMDCASMSAFEPSIIIVCFGGFGVRGAGVAWVVELTPKLADIAHVKGNVILCSMCSISARRKTTMCLTAITRGVSNFFVK